MPVIDVREVIKTYDTPQGPFTALRRVSLRTDPGEFLAVVGRSGSGKSTLINMITGIDRPTSGEVHVAGAAVHELDQHALAVWRGRNVGVVFQFFQLLPTLTVAENAMLPMDFCDTYPRAERRPRALALLERVGIAEQADKLPAALSGGQQQRAAIARALANDPPLLVADEPTGNLDSATAIEVLELFAAIAAGGTTVVMVTHGSEAAPFITSTVELADGTVRAHV
ncbi:ABC transporter ATP-binding protein [Nonomuraea turcica]|uniref:ABC transporter ATP-binding protein n=1 Tax=Nonomuraea sp. G32 TaxID=3067274 RepID=UPI00273AC37F|nr:ABC transporter ATP-binding protein [Nonomuraea sp. G32]MDP4505441.1 ABC transporter ATP-binding protein [Nonomuraea sp. G32]